MQRERADMIFFGGALKKRASNPECVLGLRVPVDSVLFFSFTLLHSNLSAVGGGYDGGYIKNGTRAGRAKSAVCLLFGTNHCYGAH
jgi:hypothetical protein